MAIHIDNIQNIPNPNTQSPTEFNSKTTAFLNSDLPTFISQANTLSDDLTDKWSNVNYLHTLIEGDKNTTLIASGSANTAGDKAISAKNDAISAKDEAISARDEIKTYVIPTDATYNPASIDAKVRMSKILAITNSL